MAAPCAFKRNPVRVKDAHLLRGLQVRFHRHFQASPDSLTCTPIVQLCYLLGHIAHHLGLLDGQLVPAELFPLLGNVLLCPRWAVPRPYPAFSSLALMYYTGSLSPLVSTARTPDSFCCSARLYTRAART